MRNQNNIKKTFNINPKNIVDDDRMDFIHKEIIRFKNSKKRKDMITGESYYIGKHDILQRKRTVIGENGSLYEVTNLPNNKIVDNQYRKLVDQKNNYLLGNALTIQTENSRYNNLLKNIINKKFIRTLKNIGEESLNNGIAWLFIYYGEDSNLEFKKFKSSEVVPFWNDDEHTKLDFLLRFYSVIDYNNSKGIITEKVEMYTTEGIYYFELNESTLKAVEPIYKNYINLIDDGVEVGYNWDKIPVIPFKYNNKEIPLIKNVKSLQDGLNLIESNFQNNMEEDSRNTIMVLINYDGENLGEFRKNLATYGAIKISNYDGEPNGDVKTLQVEINAENYQVILGIFKKAMIENAMGYDAKDDRMGSNANQMNIMSMYSDIDLDANNTETEYQASFEELLWFINIHLSNTGEGDFGKEVVNIILNRDILMNESEIIENCVKSIGILSDETIIANHPWVLDAKTEIERIKKQKDMEENQYTNAFNDNV